MPPNEQNPYDFILQQGKQQRMPSSMLQDPKNRTLLIVAFVGIVLTVVIAGILLISSLGSPENSDAVELVAYQTEIVRVIDVSMKETRDPSLRAKLATLKSFVTSDKKAMESYLSKSGVKISEAQLASKLDNSADKEITEASKRNQAESTIADVMEIMTTEYQELLENSFQNSSSETKKNTLATAANNLLLYNGEQ